MPAIIPVVAAGAAWGAAAASGFAVLSTITAIGATMSAVGTITHSKFLTRVGAVVGLVGAVGTLAFGADALGSMSELFGAEAGSAAAGGDVLSAIDDVVANTAANVNSGALSAADNIVSATGQVASANPANIINSSLSAAQGSVADIIAGGVPNSIVRDALMSGAPAGSVAPSATELSKMGTELINASGAGAEKGFLSGFGDWTKNNQMLTYGIVQAGGAFISGLTNPMTPAQIAALNAQADYNGAAAALARQQVDNMKGGIPRATVTGRPAGGLINNNPVQSAQVTGSVLNAPGPITGVPT